MSLTPSQQLSYLDRLRIYRPTRALDPTTGVWGEWTYPLAHDQVAALTHYVQNDDDPSAVGRIKRRSELQEDVFELEATADVRSGDLVVDVTPGPHFGVVSKVQGEPLVFASSGRRRSNCLFIQVMTEEAPPNNVNAL